MAKIRMTDTTFRDAHQSLWATRMHTSDMLPVAEALDNVGYNALEVWGGATFDVCMRYLGEDPWERLRTLKKHIKKTPLQMLLRGQSLVGYQHYPDDVAEAFIGRAVANGIDIIRIFDALNDLRNMEVPIRVAKREGAHVQGSVVYTVSPVHTLENYLEKALALEAMGIDSLCIKDMAGLLTPYRAYDLVKMLKDNLKIPVELHNHYIGGLAVATCMKAAEAGVDIVDTAAGPLAFGASQPPVETLVRAFQGTPYDTELDLNELFEIDEYLEKLRIKLGYERGVTRISDMRVFQHQVPGGMISNLVSQLKEQKAESRLGEVLEEIPKVREEFGYPPLVTPTSQIVGTQAVMNVLTGERYKLVPGEVKAYMKGLYGHPPAPVSQEIQKKIIGAEEPITGRPADLLEPGMEKAKEEIAYLTQDIDDIISYALFPQVAKKFFEDREKGILPEVGEVQIPKDKNTGELKIDIGEMDALIDRINASGISEFTFKEDGREIKLKKKPLKINGGHLVKQEEPDAVAISSEVAGAKQYPVTSDKVGTFYRGAGRNSPSYVEIGTEVSEGQTIATVEVMGTIHEVKTAVSGKVVEIPALDSAMVEYAQVLFVIEE